MSKKISDILKLKRLYAFPTVFLFLFLFNFSKYFLRWTIQEINTAQIMFLLSASITGTAPKIIADLVKEYILFPIYYALLLCYGIDILCFLINKQKIADSYGRIYTYILLWLSIICCTGCIKDNIDNIDISTLKNLWNNDYSDFYEREFVSPEADKIKFKHKKNLILIYAESFEESFKNAEFFPKSLLPHLERLEPEGIKFSSYQNGYASDFTQGSIIATFSGVPANLVSGELLHEIGKMITPVKNIYSLGKILKDNDYSTMAIMGSDGEFAGGKRFLKNHGIDKVIDSSTINQTQLPPNPNNGWGYDDKTVLDILKATIKNPKFSSPYFIMAITIDTHFLYIPDVNEEDIFQNKYKNVIYHSQKLIAEFIEWFKTQPEYQNTVVAIVGDHLRMGNDFKMPEQRQIYNLFLNTPRPKNTQRTFSQIDLFPTLIEAIGGDIDEHKLGLGTSLFSNEKTLLERYSPEELKEQLSKKNKLYESLWR